MKALIEYFPHKPGRSDASGRPVEHVNAANWDDAFRLAKGSADRVDRISGGKPEPEDYADRYIRIMDEDTQETKLWEWASGEWSLINA
jgi:hypothetical protein